MRTTRAKRLAGASAVLLYQQPMSDRVDAPLRPWITERSRHVVQDRWISVRADQCRTVEGSTISPFYVLEYPDWVQIVAVDDAENLILLRQYRHGRGIISLELPTGAIDKFDADPIAAARRELEEETGLRSDDWELIATTAPNPANQSNQCYVVLARGVKEGSCRQDEPSERVDIVRTPLAEVVRQAQDGTIVQATHIAALAIVLTRLGVWK